MKLPYPRLQQAAADVAHYIGIEAVDKQGLRDAFDAEVDRLIRIHYRQRPKRKSGTNIRSLMLVIRK